MRNAPKCHFIWSFLSFLWLDLLSPLPVAVSLVLCIVGEEVIRLEHWSLPSLPWSLGCLSGSTSLGRRLSPPSLFSSAEPCSGSIGTDCLSPPRYLSIKYIQINCTSSFLEPKHFGHLFLFFPWSFLFIETLQESVIKLRDDSILGDLSWQLTLLITLHHCSCPKVTRIVSSTLEHTSLSVNLIALFS